MSMDAYLEAVCLEFKESRSPIRKLEQEEQAEVQRLKADACFKIPPSCTKQTWSPACLRSIPSPREQRIHSEEEKFPKSRFQSILSQQ